MDTRIADPGSASPQPTPIVDRFAGSRRSGAVVLVLTAGLAMRIWTATADGGVLDADEAVVGLMARHFPDDFSVFFWGQAYGGSHEALVARVLFAFTGASTFALRVTAMLLSAAATFLCWRVGRRVLGARAGVVAALLFWIWPASFVWWSVKIGSSYWAALCLGLLVLLLLLRLKERPATTGEMAALGLTTGLAWWANPQAAYLIVPGIVYAASAIARDVRKLPIAGVGAALGALPWLVFNFQHRWLSFDFPGGPPTENSYVDHLEGLLRSTLPMALGLRTPFTREWVFDPVGWLAYGALVTAFVVAVLKRPRHLALPLLVAAMFPFLYATSPATWYTDQPRYALFLAPIVCLLIASALRSRWVAATVLTTAFMLSMVGLWRINTDFLPRNHGPDIPVPADFSALEDLLDDRGVDKAFADYWVAYRITFETEERALVSPVYTVRHAGLDRQVRSDANPAYIFLDGSETLSRFLAHCADHGVHAEVNRRGEWVLVEPVEKVLPEEIAGGWQCPC